jgi:rRNA maturation endonuclease Nob1
VVVVVEVVVIAEEMSVEVKVTYVVDETISDWSYSCHRCHKQMEPKDITPFQEWHICGKCMGESETFK